MRSATGLERQPAHPQASSASQAHRVAAWSVVCLAALLLPVRAAADDVQFWPTVTVYTPTTADGWRASAELQSRWSDDVSTYDRTVYRVNGGRLFANGLEVFAGYENTQPASRVARGEQRLWEQVEHTLHRGRWSVANRVRLEERFIEDAAGAAMRLRYRFKVQHALGQTRWIASAGEEFWMRLNTVGSGGPRGVDQNRITLTAARALSAHLSVEPGYLYIYANLPPPVRNLRVHVLTMQVTTRF